MAIAFKSFYWTLGTTSFRPALLNRSTEEQLRILDGFWQDPKFRNAGWTRPVQEEYYRRLKEAGLAEGDARDPDKDAREKTSGLEELGLVDGRKRLTDAGRNLLAVADKGDFAPDESNLFGISRDSYLYFLQLLKATKSIGRKKDGKQVRPFVALLFLMTLVASPGGGSGHLTMDEFTYLLPLCTDDATTRSIATAIGEARKSGTPVDVDEVVLSILMGMDNYREALDAFLVSPSVSEDLLCLVGMNRKSGTNGKLRYDAKFKPVFDALHGLVFDGVSEPGAKALLESINGLSPTNVPLWKCLFFPAPPDKQVTAPYSGKLRLAGWTADETAFRTRFFETLHLLRAKANLKDYADLNRRYFSLSDCVVFRDGRVELDALPAAFAERLAGWLSKAAFSTFGSPGTDVPLESIVQVPLPEKEELVEAATGLSGEQVAERGGAREVLKARRHARFRAFLDGRFGPADVARLLGMLEDRKNDGEIQKFVTDNADVPTIFEYLVALAWYHVSGKEGDVLDYMNLSLGADFLPKTHAGGGKADIVWKYGDNPPHYGRHALLIEVTLSEKDSQRRMEMEPVSRHLGEYLLNHADDKGAYCVFVSTHLNLNVVSDFRGRKTMLFYSDDGQSAVRGMKIVPLDTALLRTLLDSGVSYSDLHGVFERLFQMEREPREWFVELRRELESFRRAALAEPLVP